MTLDQDGDHKVSRSEARGRIAEHFDFIDTNQDGFIDKQELSALKQKMSGNATDGAGQIDQDWKLKKRNTNTFNHETDFSVITVGTGSPIYNPRRSGPCSLIHIKGEYILVDMGNGTLARLSEAGIPLSDIGTFMFTHHHLDHNEEFIPLFIKTVIPRRGDLKIIGPPQTKEYYDFVMQFYGKDMTYRAKLSGLSMGTSSVGNVTEVKSKDSFYLNGVSVSTIEVPHSIYTLAYRFDVQGKSIVISGDLSYSENLIKLAKGADILVMDSGQVIQEKGHEWIPMFMNKKSGSQSHKKPPKAHASLQEVATMAQKAGVKRMVLTHFLPGRVDKEATAEKMSTIYSGEIIFGEDLMEVIP